MSCARPNTPRSDPHDWGQLANPLRDRLWTMCEDFGLVPISLYRDPGRQWDLRHERVPGHECDSRYKGHPTTAVPATFNPATGQWEGGSLHQHRQAGDVDGWRLHEALAVCIEYGLCAPVRGENWHYQTHPTAKPTRPIRRYPGPTYEDEDDMFTDDDRKQLAAIDKRLTSVEAKSDRLIKSAQTNTARVLEIVRGIRNLLRHFGLAK